LAQDLMGTGSVVQETESACEGNVNAKRACAHSCVLEVDG